MKFNAHDLRFEPAVTGGIKVSFFVDDAVYQSDMLHKYDGQTFTAEIKAKKKGRSLDANAYCWVLAGKIAESKDILVRKDDVYLQAIRDYGVSTVMPIQDELLNDILRWHVDGGLGNQYRILGKSKFPGYTNVQFYYGSSSYDQKQFSKLIDGLIEDCKDLGIPTDTPEEIEYYKSLVGSYE